MKTLIILNQLDCILLYAIVDGDYSKYNDIKIEHSAPDFETKKLMSECAKFISSIHEYSTDTNIIASKKWDAVVVINNFL